jgi:hypothetical protein
VARLDAVDPTTGGAAHLRREHEASGLAIAATTVVDVYAEASARVRARASPAP